MKRYHFATVGSTNDYARELLQEEDIVVVTADYQLTGRGRNNRTWLGDYGDNVFLSIGFNHTEAPDENRLSSFQAVGCLAARKALVSLAGQAGFMIKYPNDVFIRTESVPPSKICGILVEHGFAADKPVYSIIGIGINVNQKHFPQGLINPASSLALAGARTDVDTVIDALIGTLMEYLVKSYDEVFSEWVREMAIIGKNITFANNGSAWTVDRVLPNGNLLAVAGDETIIINNGDSIRYELFSPQ